MAYLRWGSRLKVPLSRVELYSRIWNYGLMARKKVLAERLAPFYSRRERIIAFRLKFALGALVSKRKQRSSGFFSQAPPLQNPQYATGSIPTWIPRTEMASDSKWSKKHCKPWNSMYVTGQEAKIMAAAVSSTWDIAAFAVLRIIKFLLFVFA